MFSLSDAGYLVALTMAHRNFEIRFYNHSFDKAEMSKHDWISAVACCFQGFNQRMHNKLQLADDLVGLVGGRNLADRYFDYDKLRQGPRRSPLLARPWRKCESLDWFGRVPRRFRCSTCATSRKCCLSSKRRSRCWPRRRLAYAAVIADRQFMQQTFVDAAFQVGRLEYFSDRPRKQAFPEDAPNQDVTQELFHVLTSARQSVVIQSPYMVLSKRARRVFAELRERNPDIELVFSTNSLASTDADTVYAHTHRHKDRYVDELGFRMYEFKPFPFDAPDFFPRWPQLMEEKKAGISSQSTVSGDDSTMPMPAPRVGLHSKSFVVDGRVAMIGSHNFDPRSESFNTENGLVVWDAAFARALEQLIRRDIEPQNSWVVAMRPDRAQQQTAIETPPGNNTEFLPWFYGSTSVYELAPGKEPVPPGSADFYRNYYSVGSFPEVIRTRRQINVLFLGSFFFFLEPIL
jgi:phosphatidylserine/phosphatidylglycerophosphate/cardiolipin synthase-like enzyme